MGGVDLYLTATNRSTKTIKYAWFTVLPYNAGGDVVESEVGSHSRYTGSVTGPVRPGGSVTRGGYWENAWYNNTVVRAELTGVKLEYTDGTEIELSGEDLALIQY